MYKILSTELLTCQRANKVPIHLLSTLSPAPERLESFRTPENKPANHTVGNTAQFYKIPQDIRKQLFTHGGIPKSYHIQTQTFTETCLMVREPALDIINCIKSVDYTKPPVRFVLFGKKGCGKSLSLAHIIHHAYDTGHLLVHVPWVGSWMRRCKEYSNSETREGYVDLNLDAAAWLIQFKSQNAHILTNPELKTHVDYNWTKRESTPKGATLIELMDHGINRVKFASETVVALCKEIKQLSIEGKCKTMIAIDGFNAFFCMNTRVYTEKKEMVPPERITLTEGFLELTKTDWKNGVCVLTVDEIAASADAQESYFPRYLLGKNGFEHLDPFIPIAVNDYSSKEFISCMNYYRERKWVQPLPGQDEELVFLSASNPYNLMQLCGPL